MKETPRATLVELNSLRFLQNYVKRSTVEAKRWIEHLQCKWGGDWRDHISELQGDISPRVREQLALIDLGLPLEVERRGDIYIAQNGTHTAYSHWKRGIERIPIILSTNVNAGTRPIYTFQEIRVED